MWYKESGKVKYYFYNGESKPLRDHLQDIFPKANSVDIYYMVDTLRRKAMKDDDITRLLLEADLGNILPGYQNKR
jgi:hypothetical protein